MTQSKLTSFIEACLNTLIGYCVSFIAQLIVYPAFGAHFSLVDNFWIGIIFMVLSLARSYVIRRYFNAKLHRAIQQVTGEMQYGKVL